MAKLSKKEWGYIGGVVIVSLVILWLLYRKGQTMDIVNGDGQKPDTNYLNYNIPPINGNGLALPNLGNVVVPPMNLNLGGCNQCYQSPYYSSPIELANALGSAGQPSIADAVSKLPNYMQVQLDQQYTAGSVDDINRRVLSSVGAIMVPGWMTDQTNMKQPAPVSSGPSGLFSADDLWRFEVQNGVFDIDN